MQVKDIMTKEVVCVGPSTKVTEVADIMLSNRFHGVPVVDSEKIILGIITENDFFDKKEGDIYIPTYIKVMESRRMSEDLSNEEKNKVDEFISMKAKDIMTAGCITVSSNMELGELIDVFKKTAFNTLVVADKDNALEGVVTLADVINLIRL